MMKKILRLLIVFCIYIASNSIFADAQDEEENQPGETIYFDISAVNFHNKHMGFDDESAIALRLFYRKNKDKEIRKLVIAKLENISIRSEDDYNVIKDENYIKANEFMKLGNYRQASLAFEQCMVKNPRSTIPLTGLTRSLFKEDKFTESKTVFNSYLEKLKEIGDIEKKNSENEKDDSEQTDSKQ